MELALHSVGEVSVEVWLWLKSSKVYGKYFRLDRIPDGVSGRIRRV
jgi:hypothetical protein